MKTLQKLGLFFYFFVPLVKLAPRNQQQPATFYNDGLATLEGTIYKDYEDTFLKDDYEDKPQDALKTKVSSTFEFIFPILNDYTIYACVHVPW